MANEVIGLAELEQALARIRKVATPANMRIAGNAGMLEIINAAKAAAPVLTGTLRRSLHVGGNLQGDSSEYSDIGPGPGDTLEVIVWGGTNVEYAASVEFGTDQTKAQPYLRPAVASKRGAASQVAGKVFAGILARSI